MNPDALSLLDDLTAARGDAGEGLIKALRQHRHRRTQRRALAAGAIAVAAIAAGIRFLPHESAPSHVVTIEPRLSSMLTESELLDSFGDQPVALVTWPDGRQQLLAIAHAPLPGATR
jgi:hypothetical protein